VRRHTRPRTLRPDSPYTAQEIGAASTTDFITQSALYNALLSGISGAIPLDGIDEVKETLLAVQGAAIPAHRRAPPIR
jgi:hypothetical protein